jgi:bifunctional non-homologous end joining protein LigD
VAAPLKRPDKVLFPDVGIDKRGLLEYLEAVAPALLRHVRRRPLVLQRFPDGVSGAGFYQKRAGRSFPPSIERVTVESSRGPVDHLVLRREADLAALADQAVVTLHRWGSRVPDVRRPDVLVFDLDPPGEEFAPVRRAAFLVRALLEEELGLAAFVQTTGAKGAHVVVPVRPEQDFHRLRAFATTAARILEARHPDSLTTAFRKAARGGRLFLDVRRNAWAQTAVAPYSPRARPGAPVATPVTWEELARPSLHARSFDLRTVPERLRAEGDPWQRIAQHARPLEPRWGALEALAGDISRSLGRSVRT